MKNTHIFISAIDINEQLPFVVKKTKKLQQTLQEQERARQELDKFILILEKKFKEPLFYLGMDVIGEKSYERFMFKDSGFFEVMVEAPLAFNAHFPERKRAVKFCKALKEAITFEIINPSPTKTDKA